MPRLTWYIYYRTQTTVEDILSVLFVIGKTCTSFVFRALGHSLFWLLCVPVVLTSTIWKYSVGISHRTLLTLSSVLAFRTSTVPLVGYPQTSFILYQPTDAMFSGHAPLFKRSWCALAPGLGTLCIPMHASHTFDTVVGIDTCTVASLDGHVPFRIVCVLAPVVTPPII